MWADLSLVEPLLKSQGYNINNPWDVVKVFEEKVAKFAGSKYAIALDNCTNALFLCLKYIDYRGEIEIPAKTYISVPFTIINSGCTPKLIDKEWSGSYKLEPTNIVDAATKFTKGMYEQGTLHCISFHLKKILPDVNPDSGGSDTYHDLRKHKIFGKYK